MADGDIFVDCSCVSNVRFGSLAALSGQFSVMSGLGGKGVVRNPGFCESLAERLLFPIANVRLAQIERI